MRTPKNADAGKAVIDLLEGRKGFDWWWQKIPTEVRREIVKELNDLVVLKDTAVV